jgi:hypothetical protein
MGKIGSGADCACVSRKGIDVTTHGNAKFPPPRKGTARQEEPRLASELGFSASCLLAGSPVGRLMKLRQRRVLCATAFVRAFRYNRQRLG